MQKIKPLLASSDFRCQTSGEKLANLYSDAIAKKAFSPDKHPERLDFLLQHIMNDKSLEVLHSASNESIILSLTPKKPQSQSISRITALFLSREKRNAA